jgi:hypothetical protein
MVRAVAVNSGDGIVNVIYSTDSGDERSFLTDSETFTRVREILKEGFVLQDMVLRPNAITNYLRGTDANAIISYNSIEADKMRRKQASEAMTWIIKYGGFVFMCLLGVGVLYMMTHGSTPSAAPVTTGTLPSLR